MSLLQNSNAISAGGAYNITDSLRFRSSASAYLSRTLSASGTTNTWSFWIKRGKLGSTQSIFDWSDGVSTSFGIVFTSSDALDFYNYVSAYTMRLVTTQVFRDPSAWYHIVVVMDTTNATSSDRVKVYVNGNRLTSFSTATYPTQNLSLNIATSRAFDIGAVGTSHGQNFDGYMTEFNFIDGQALTPSDFGETNADGVWSPIEYTGTYGTNGFYLPMKETTQATGFNTVLWSGNGGTQSISNVGFSPDLVWVKARAGTDGNSYNLLYDTVRGAGKFLSSNTTNAETGNSGDLLGSFDSNGFSVNTSLTGGTNPSTSGSGTTFVGWCWDAGSSTVSNTDGTITSSVRANPASGFSIVTFTGNATAGATVGHGLGSAPKMVIYKARNNGNDWWTYHAGLTSAAYAIQLNTTNAENNTVNFFNSTAPDSSVLTLGYWNNATGFNLSTQNYVAYCFSEVAGFSKFGSYTGNGSTSGPTVTTGFRPAFVMWKRTDVAGESWYIVDSTRDPDNNPSLQLRPNLSDAETSTTNRSMTFTDTGFQVTGNDSSTNASGGTYIYMAFADTRDFQWNFDASGNKNNWTPNNINSNASSETTYDLMSDVPFPVDEDTGNFCTLNPLDVSFSSGNVYYNGNLDVSWTNTSSGISGSAFGSIGVNTGKWIFEATVSSYTGSSTLSIGWWGTSYLTRITPSANGVYTVAIDFDNQLAWFATNGTFTGDPEAGTGGTSITVDTSIPYFPLVRDNSGSTGNGAYFAVNFGQRPFKYTPPTGYKKLNTYNLPDSTIKDGSQYFDTNVWTGNGTSQTITNSGEMSPDLVWIKSRSVAGYYHVLIDSVRGITKALYSNATDAENTLATRITAINSNGFTVGSSGDVNDNAQTFVGWQWRGSDSTAVSNTDGTITSTVSANTTSGFSVVTYTGNGSSGSTVGHGLGTAPKMVIVKNRTAGGAGYWLTWHANMTSASYYLALNLTIGQTLDTTVWNATAPTSSVFSLGTNTTSNNSGTNFVAYCFADVEGFSKFGSYTGNGSTDGPFVYTGFRPKYILIKRTDTTESWEIFDTTRSSYNTSVELLEANTSGAESTSSGNAIDILSNGFKQRNIRAATNASGGTYIYMAFAEVPFKNSLGR